MHFYEEFLPVQEEYMKLAPRRSLPKYCHEATLFDFLGTFNGFANYDDLKLEVPENMPIENMASNPVTIALLQFLIQMQRTEVILEIGTYIGISAIKMAQVLPQGGCITTIEKGLEFSQIANRNIKANNFSGRPIVVARGDALILVHSWASSPVRVFDDMIFLDADKEHYDKYLKPLSVLLKPGGLLIVDDVLFHGDVLNAEPTTDKGRGCKRLLEKAKAMHWPGVLLPLANGILILQKPR